MENNQEKLVDRKRTEVAVNLSDLREHFETDNDIVKALNAVKEEGNKKNSYDFTVHKVRHLIGKKVNGNTSLFKKILRVIKVVHKKEKIEKPYYRNYKEEYYNFLRLKLSKELEHSRNLHSVKELIADMYMIQKEDVSKFITSFPTVPFSIIEPQLFSKDYVSHLLPVSSPPISRGEFVYDIENLKIKEKKAKSDKKFKDYEGFLLGHALSPYSDNIALFYELGRFKRMSDIFEKDGNILLVNIEWAKDNRTVQQFKEKGVNINKMLTRNKLFREKLYEKLSLEYKSPSNKEIHGGYEKSKSTGIDKLSKEYENYAKLLCKAFEVNPDSKNEVRKESQKLKNQIQNLTHSDGKQAYSNELQNDLKLLTYSIVKDEDNLMTIATVIGYHGAIDQATFRYTLLQRYAVHGYNKFLKIGVKSEAGFDHSFNEMDQIEGITDFEMDGIYFQHYYFRDKNFHVIPYYSPSGQLYREINDKDKWANNVILIFDFEKDSQREKVEKIIADMDLDQLAIQFSDLQSFLHYLLPQRTLNKLNQNYIKDFSEEWFQNWALHIEDEEKKSLKKFANNNCTMLLEDLDLPFYFYPYLIALKCYREGDSELQEKFRQLYKSFLLESLEEVNNLIPA